MIGRVVFRMIIQKQIPHNSPKLKFKIPKTCERYFGLKAEVKYKSQQFACEISLRALDIHFLISLILSIDKITLQSSQKDQTYDR